jgi:hypothetical protein
MSERIPRAVAIIGAAAFIIFGVWALVDPRSFFGSVARFEPFNQHFLQDIGAFQIGLGAVLLLAAAVRNGDALTAALLGTGVGAAFHALSHLLGMHLGGSPVTDIPLFSGVAVALLGAGLIRWRAVRSHPAR